MEETEENNRQATLDFLARKDLRLLCFLKDSHRFVLSSGLHRINWEIPSFEIGYWCRTSETGKGLVTEATGAIMNFAFSVLGAQRIEVRVDEVNERSCKVAERLGLQLEGTFRADARDTSGALRNTRVYARIRSEFEASRNTGTHL